MAEEEKPEEIIESVENVDSEAGKPSESIDAEAAEPSENVEADEPEPDEKPVLKVNSKVGVSVPDLLDGGMMARNEAIGSVINKALKKVFGDKGKKKEKD